MMGTVMMDTVTNTTKKDPGPNGGRILNTMTPALEFFVLEDRRVQITALNDLKPIPVNEQTATLTGGDRNNPTTLEFAKDGDVLISDKPLPTGNNIPVILQVTNAPGTTPIMEKIQVNFSVGAQLASIENTPAGVTTSMGTKISMVTTNTID